MYSDSGVSLTNDDEPSLPGYTLDDIPLVDIDVYKKAKELIKEREIAYSNIKDVYQRENKVCEDITLSYHKEKNSSGDDTKNDEAEVYLYAVTIMQTDLKNGKYTLDQEKSAFAFKKSLEAVSLKSANDLYFSQELPYRIEQYRLLENLTENKRYISDESFSRIHKNLFEQSDSGPYYVPVSSSYNKIYSLSELDEFRETINNRKGDEIYKIETDYTLNESQRDLLNYDILQIERLDSYLKYIIDSNVEKELLNYKPENNYLDVIFAQEILKQIEDKVSVEFDPYTEIEFEALIYHLIINKRIASSNLTKLQSIYVFQSRRLNPITKVVVDKKPEGYFTLADLKKSDEYESQKIFNDHFYDYEEKYLEYDAKK